jgi:hypothetical protein
VSGWGSGPWGTSTWGEGVGAEAPVEGDNIVILTEVKIVSADLLELTFDRTMKITPALVDPEGYVVQPFDASRAKEVTVKEVRAGDSNTDSVLLVITPMTLGEAYDVFAIGSMRSVDNKTMSTQNNQRVIARRTKVDSLCSTRQPVYDLRPESVFRNILNAIGREDDRIGGSQDEGGELIR